MTVVQFVEETVLLVPMSALTTLRTGSDGDQTIQIKLSLSQSVQQMFLPR